MIPKFIDSHTHVHFDDFDVDREEVIRRAFEAGIWMINIGTDENYSQKAVDLANQYQGGVYASIGIHPVRSFQKTSNGVHPNEAAIKEKIDWDLMRKLADDNKVVGIGECGLDYFRTVEPELRIKQKEIFLKHIEIAKEIKKPLIIHCRPSKGSLDAYQDLMEILKQYYTPDPKPHTLNNGVIHFYQGDSTTAQRFFELGFLVSFSGIITFGNEYDSLIKELPLDKILVETDAPFAAPVPYRGWRNEPLYITETAKKIAAIKKISLGEISEQLTKNTRELFKGLSSS